MINELVNHIATSSGLVIGTLLVGGGIFFSLGCCLTHISRGFYLMPLISVFIGFLFLEGIILTGDFVDESMMQLAESLVFIAVVLLGSGAYVFGECNIKRHKIEASRR